MLKIGSDIVLPQKLHSNALTSCTEVSGFKCISRKPLSTKAYALHTASANEVSQIQHLFYSEIATCSLYCNMDKQHTGSSTLYINWPYSALSTCPHLTIQLTPFDAKESNNLGVSASNNNVSIFLFVCVHQARYHHWGSVTPYCHNTCGKDMATINKIDKHIQYYSSRF